MNAQSKDDYISELHAQRDALLAALREFVCAELHGSNARYSRDELMGAARAAIAKAPA